MSQILFLSFFYIKCSQNQLIIIYGLKHIAIFASNRNNSLIYWISSNKLPKLIQIDILLRDVYFFAILIFTESFI